MPFNELHMLILYNVIMTRKHYLIVELRNCPHFYIIRRKKLGLMLFEKCVAIFTSNEKITRFLKNFWILKCCFVNDLMNFLIMEFHAIQIFLPKMNCTNFSNREFTNAQLSRVAVYFLIYELSIAKSENLQVSLFQ